MSNCKDKSELMRLFLEEHKNEYLEFINILNVLRCDINAFYKYLDSFSFEFPPFGVFNVSYFCDFCRKNNINIARDGAEELTFAQLTSRFYDCLFDITNAERLLLCPPNDIFVNQVLTGDISYIINIDWNNINIDNMFYLRNYVFLDNNYDENLKLLKSYLSGLKKAPAAIDSYGVIVSQVLNNNNYEYIVRAICRENFISLDVAFNSQYTKTLKKVI